MRGDERSGVSRRALLGAVVLGATPGARADGLQRQQRTLFGSPCTLLAPGSAPPASADSARLWQRLAQLNADWNAWKPGVLGTVNAALRAGRPAAVPADLARLLRLAREGEVATAGFFNAGLGALVAAWGFHADELQPGNAPPEALLRRWRGAPPGLRHAEWRDGHLIGHHPALQLDLGGIAKGWVVDEALDALQRRGVGAALLDLGGNLAAFGQGADGPWRVGIRDPFGPGLVARLRTAGREAVVTSGTYERWRRVDGAAVGHVIDPPAARPAAELVSVTVVHPRAALAAAAATALLAAGAARWPAVAERLGVDQVLVIDAQGRAAAHARLARRLDLAGTDWRRRLRIL
ncbi:MAG: FAD:protein FMN transferase [Piscinibacter sp.]|nr:FAD:protein FMN transferase [Piscinibacter sp.]